MANSDPSTGGEDTVHLRHLLRVGRLVLGWKRSKTHVLPRRLETDASAARWYKNPSFYAGLLILPAFWALLSGICFWGRAEAVGVPLVKDLLSVAGVLLLVLLFRFISPRTDGETRRRHVFLAMFLTAVNVALARASLELGEYGGMHQLLQHFPRHEGGAHALFWLTPPALSAIAVAVLCGARLGMLSALLVSTVCALTLGRGVGVLLVFALASFAGVWVVCVSGSRGTILKAGTVSGVVAALPMVGVCYQNWQASPHLLWLWLPVIGSIVIGVLTGVLTLGMLPVLERVFSVTSEMTLKEMATDHPLILKMEAVAPGSLEHSRNVAKLAEAAAKAIGANAVLCNCAAIFHDIGKMKKPEYFVENQSGDENPHDLIQPTISASIIKEHVSEGVAIAEHPKYRLPREVRAIIRQHHGTDWIEFFFNKANAALREPAAKGTAGGAAAAGGNALPPPVEFDARPASGYVSAMKTLRLIRSALQKNDPATLRFTKLKPPETARSVEESQYRYEGPKPQTRESGIVMLADGIEAAFHTLPNREDKDVRAGFVNEMIFGRILRGQLDECPLTFSELAKVRDAFINTLQNMAHRRISYDPPAAQTPAPAPANAPAPAAPAPSGA
ncbi:MAG: HDIG domain-containing protein [Puniceicoccales bacterium]|jgi:putative nucleotidyltransferase with HDIG domain|nr:HDIG domain-containing protein [Puniceicoccales bacterium]